MMICSKCAVRCLVVPSTGGPEEFLLLSFTPKSAVPLPKCQSPKHQYHRHYGYDDFGTPAPRANLKLAFAADKVVEADAKESSN